jgi:hypothetical protein
MRKDPDKYSHLIHNNSMSSTADYSGQSYSTDSYGQQQQHPSQDYIDVLIQEAEKLYNKLAKELGDESISDCPSSASSSLLPSLPASDEGQQKPCLPKARSS